MDREVKFLRKSCPKRTKPYHKYLKPGALAQMRDSRISARSLRVDSLSLIYLLRSSTSPSSPPLNTAQTQINVIDEIACFAGRVMAKGPVSLRRKKIAAIKSSWLPTSVMQTPSETQDPIVDVISSDVSAH